MPEIRTLQGLLLVMLLATPGVAGGLADAIAAGNAAMRAGQVEEAKTRYAAGFVHAPEAPELHYSMGLAHLRAGERDKAAEFFRGAAERAEAGGKTGLAARSSYNLGIALAEGPGSAEEPAQVAGAGATAPPGDEPAAVLGSGPRPPAPANPLGNAAGGLPFGAGGPDWKGALGAFEKAIRLDPSDLDAKYNYLRVRKRLEEMEQSSQDQQDGEPNEDESSEDENKSKDSPGEGEGEDQGDGQEGQGEDDQKPPEDQDGQQPGQGQQPDSGSSQDATNQGSPDSSPEGPEGEKDMDRQAMERFLDAVEAESKDQLKRFLQGRRAEPRELKHDW